MTSSWGITLGSVAAALGLYAFLQWQSERQQRPPFGRRALAQRPGRRARFARRGVASGRRPALVQSRPSTHRVAHCAEGAALRPPS